MPMYAALAAAALAFSAPTGLVQQSAVAVRSDAIQMNTKVRSRRRASSIHP